MQHHDVLHSPRLLELKRRRRHAFFVKIFSIFAIFLVVFALLVYLSRLEQFKISELEVVGNKTTEEGVIEGILEKHITGYYLWFFPKNNILLYPKKTIRNEIQEKFKNFKNINLSVTKGKVLEVAFMERESRYIWCGMNLPEVTSSAMQKCYFVDGDGYIFALAPFFSGEVYFRFYGGLDISIDKENTPVGQYLLNDDFARVVSFKGVLEDMDLKPVALYTENGTKLKMYLQKEKNELLGPEIIFPINADFVNLAENLKTALQTEPMLSNFRNKYSSLEYIDLSFGNKVYYRFK